MRRADPFVSPPLPFLLVVVFTRPPLRRFTLVLQTTATSVTRTSYVLSAFSLSRLGGTSVPLSRDASGRESHLGRVPSNAYTPAHKTRSLTSPLTDPHRPDQVCRNRLRGS